MAEVYWLALLRDQPLAAFEQPNSDECVDQR